MYYVFIFTKGYFMKHMIGSPSVPEWQVLLAEHEYRSFRMNPDDINEMFFQYLEHYRHRGFSSIMLIFDRNAESEREVYIFPLHRHDIEDYQHKFGEKGYNFETKGYIINIQAYLQEIKTHNNASELLEGIYQYLLKPWNTLGSHLAPFSLRFFNFSKRFLKNFSLFEKK